MSVFGVIVAVRVTRGLDLFWYWVFAGYSGFRAIGVFRVIGVLGPVSGLEGL